jgi:hypothetical protein
MSDTSYIQAKHKHPYSAFRHQCQAVHQSFDGGRGYRIQTISISQAESSRTNVNWKIFLFDTSKDCWRNRFDHLLGAWLKCWRSGLGEESTNADLRITPTEGKFLKAHVRKHFKGGLGPPPRIPWGPRERRWKGKVASDIIRQFRKGYKQPQAVSFHHVSPGTNGGATIVRKRYE